MRSDADFEEFYTVNYGKVVALVTGVLGDWAEADDIAQETFARALARWPRLSSYELPEAWVRQVAIRLAIDSTRRVRRTLRLLPRLVRPGVDLEEPALSLGFTPLGRALARLPLREREVMVLYYVADLTANRIAHERGIPVSTVKARLASGRRRLERDLTPQERGR